MTLPLIVLAVGSAVAGLVGIPQALTGGTNWNLFERWLEPVIVSVEPAAKAAPGANPATTPEARATEELTAPHAEPAHERVDPMEYWLMLLSLAIAAGGIYLGRAFYVKRPDLPRVWAAKLRPLYKLSFN